jgi:hypothetical protein
MNGWGRLDCRSTLCLDQVLFPDEMAVLPRCIHQITPSAIVKWTVRGEWNAIDSIIAEKSRDSTMDSVILSIRCLMVSGNSGDRIGMELNRMEWFSQAQFTEELNDQSHTKELLEEEEADMR